MEFLCWMFAVYIVSSSVSSDNGSDSDETIEASPPDYDAIDSTLNSIFSANLCGDLLVPTDGEIYLTTSSNMHR